MLRSLLAPVALGLFLSACGAPPPVVPAEAPAKGGDALTKPDPSAYPVGPFGYVEGQVIENLEFLGRADDNNNGIITDDAIRSIHLSDIYKDKSIKALAILVAAEWCGPCQAEQFELVQSFNKYKAAKAGVFYLEALIESADSKRSPADIGTVDRWSARKWPSVTDKAAVPLVIPFPVVADPTVLLGPYYPYPAFPMQIAVDTKNMTIVWRNNGYAAGALEGYIDQILSGGN